MKKSVWPHMGTVLKVNALNYPDKPGWQDKDNEFTFREWNERACRVAKGLRNIGAGHKDSFAVISYNRGEWMDIYAGCAKGGQMIVPVMFRLSGPEIQYIVNHSKCRAFIVEKPFVELINGIRRSLPIPKNAYIYIGDGPVPDGYIGYEDWLCESSFEEPDYEVNASDIWTIMYTSGTTGKPKGVMKTHEAQMAEYYLNAINFGFRPTDKSMMVMPMCHVNSILYSFSFTLLSATVFVYKTASFNPEDLLKSIEKYKGTFTSLVPTHYSMLLDLPDAVKNRIDVSSIRNLLVSSAPTGKKLKLAILEYFKEADLWEAYGCTEGGLGTLLRPEDQFKKLGSIGKEIFGIDRIRILGEDKNEVPDGEVGELFYNTPMLFKEYLHDPEKTQNTFFNGWFSAGDMVRRDEDGYYFLVDRKANMIITGGENVYPSEVENALSSHNAVRDIAVIGIPDDKWGEAIKAVIVLRDGYKAGDSLKKDIIKSARSNLAGYKLPKSIDFIKEDEMPRTSTGKILHRVLRDKYGRWSNEK